MPEGSGQWGLPPPHDELERSTPNFTVSVSLRCVLRGPFCQPCYLVCFRAQWSPAGVLERLVQMLPYRFAVSGRLSNCTTTYKPRNQSREAGTSSRIFDSMETSAKHISLGPADYKKMCIKFSWGLARPGLWGCCPPRWPPSRFW